MNVPPQNTGSHTALRDSNPQGKKPNLNVKSHLSHISGTRHSLLSITHSPHLPGSPQGWAMPHPTCKHQDLPLEGVPDTEFSFHIEIVEWIASCCQRFQGELKDPSCVLSCQGKSKRCHFHLAAAQPDCKKQAGRTGCLLAENSSESWSKWETA